MWTLTVKGDEKSLKVIQKRFRQFQEREKVVFELSKDKQEPKKPAKKANAKKE